MKLTKFLSCFVQKGLHSVTIRKFASEQSWNLTIKKELASGKTAEAMATWLLMKKNNVAPDEETNKLLINLFKNTVSVIVCKYSFDRMTRKMLSTLSILLRLQVLFLLIQQMLLLRFWSNR